MTGFISNGQASRRQRPYKILELLQEFSKFFSLQIFKAFSIGLITFLLLFNWLFSENYHYFGIIFIRGLGFKNSETL